MHRGRTRAAPPWWPATEPWPPADPAWRRRRARFMRRAGLLFGLVVILSVIGAARVVSWLAGSVAGGPISVSPLAIPLTALAVLFIVVPVAIRRFGLPLGDIIGAANRVADGDFSARIAEHGPPSLRVVARAVNGMASRLEAQEQQRRNVMADIAHELRTPLTVVQGRIEGLIDGVYPRDEVHLTEIAHQTRVLSRLVDDLQTLARAESGTFALRKEPTDLGALLEDVARTFSQEA